MKRTTRAASGGPGREMTPCYGSSGVTIVVPGASWRVVFSGRLIQTTVGGGLGAWRPLHEPLGMGETGAVLKEVAAIALVRWHFGWVLLRLTSAVIQKQLGTS